MPKSKKELGKFLVVLKSHIINNRNLVNLINFDSEIDSLLDASYIDVLFINVEDEICSANNLISKLDQRNEYAYKICDSNLESFTEWFHYNNKAKINILRIIEENRSLRPTSYHRQINNSLKNRK